MFEITPTMVAAYARVKGGRPIRVRDPIILADALRDAVAALVGKSKDAAHKRLIGKPEVTPFASTGAKFRGGPTKTLVPRTPTPAKKAQVASLVSGDGKIPATWRLFYRTM